MRSAYSRTRTAENQHRFNKFRRSVHGRSNVRKDFISIRLRERRRGKKLGISVYAGKVMSKIVRDGARHASDRGQAFRLQQSLVCAQNLIAHARKRKTQFSHFARSAARKQMGTVALAESANTGGQVLERLRHDP